MGVAYYPDVYTGFDDTGLFRIDNHWFVTARSTTPARSTTTCKLFFAMTSLRNEANSNSTEQYMDWGASVIIPSYDVLVHQGQMVAMRK